MIGSLGAMFRRGGAHVVAPEEGSGAAAAAGTKDRTAKVGDPPSELPASLSSHAMLSPDMSEVFVDERYRGHPGFLSWIDVQDLLYGRRIRVFSLPARELAAKREELAARHDLSQDLGLNTLQKARRLFSDAAESGASDIHLLVRAQFAEVQLRVKGELWSVETMSRNEGESIIRASCQGLAAVREAMFAPYEFQDAQIDGASIPGSGLSSVRIIRGPAHPQDSGGGFMIARLQYGGERAEKAGGQRKFDFKVPTRPGGASRIASLGYTPKQVAMLNVMASMSSGVNLVTGPTGSGKTTTLFELMKEQARRFPGKRQLTIENPVEYPMEWAIQMAVTGAGSGDAAGKAFYERVRVSLRMDPDIILLGELRAAEESKAAIAEALTGHLVWATLHVTDPFMSIDRLEQMDRVDLARGVICNPKIIRGLVSQKLVGTLCPECSTPLAKADPQSFRDGLIETVKSWGDIDSVRVRGGGCDHCSGTGVVGRKAAAEVVLPDQRLMLDFINEGTIVATRNHRLREDADKSMLGNAMDLVLAGQADPRDIESEIDAIVEKARGI